MDQRASPSGQDAKVAYRSKATANAIRGNGTQGLSLPGFLDVEHGYLSHPARAALVASDDQAKRPFRRRQHMAIPTVGKDSSSVREIRIELG